MIDSRRRFFFFLRNPNHFLSKKINSLSFASSSLSQSCRLVTYAFLNSRKLWAQLPPFPYARFQRYGLRTISLSFSLCISMAIFFENRTFIPGKNAIILEFQISLRSRSREQRLGGALLPAALSLRRRRSLRFRSFAVRVSASASSGPRSSGSSRRVYRESQSQSLVADAPVKQIASVVAPAGLLLAVTFGN